jgi:hypothetical protein
LLLYWRIGCAQKGQDKNPIDLDLRDSWFGVILSAEQIDVRRVLLADSPFAPSLGARTSLQTENKT